MKHNLEGGQNDKVGSDGAGFRHFKERCAKPRCDCCCQVLQECIGYRSILRTTPWHTLLYYLSKGLSWLLATVAPCKAAQYFLDPCSLQEAERVLVKV